MMSTQKPEHLLPYSIRLSTINQVLNRCLDEGYFDCHKKEDAIYNKAIIKLCLSCKEVEFAELTKKCGKFKKIEL